MRRKDLISTAAINYLQRHNFVELVEVLPDRKLLRVKSAHEGLLVSEGDLLRVFKIGRAGCYRLIKKVGRPSVGGVYLTGLTVSKEIAEHIAAESERLGKTRQDVRREILKSYFTPRGGF